MSPIQQLAKRLLQYKVQLLFSVFFMLSYSIFTVAPIKFSKNIVDSLVESLRSGESPELSRFFLVGGGIMLILVFKGISYFAQTYLMGSLGQKVIRDLRGELYNKIILMPIAFYNKQSTGDLTSRFTVDFVTLNEAIRISIVGPLRDAPQIFLLLGMMLMASWKLFLLTILLLPLAAWLITIFGRQNKKVTKKRLNRFGSLTALLTETITGIRVVKAFSMEKYESKRFSQENNRLYKNFVDSILIDSYSYPLLELSAGACAVTILIYGGYLSLHETITAGDYVNFLLAFFMLNEPIKKMNGINLKVQEGSAAANRIFEVLDSDWKIHDAPDAEKLESMNRDIHVDIKSFDYGDGHPVLKNVNITLKAGTITALVGTSGSGKTTLANLIPRFYELPPSMGLIQIGHQDIQKLTLRSLRGQIGIVTQDVTLFNDTVASNISYGNIQCTDEQIVEAAKAGYADRFIRELPDGYNQEVGEKGTRLSGGQKQRIAISRALIKDAPLLILDEATSALDTESEKEVQAAIENLMKNRTTLVIAHRLSTIQNADVIHVMKNGQVMESGNHTELMRIDGEYKRLYEMQFKETPSK